MGLPPLRCNNEVRPFQPRSPPVAAPKGSPGDEQGKKRPCTSLLLVAERSLAQEKTGATIVELVLNLIGLYGVGWLMFGNLAGGIVLLVVSLLLWPVVALVGIFTMGLGVICLGPVAIVAMVINLVLLQQAITRKAC